MWRYTYSNECVTELALYPGSQLNLTGTKVISYCVCAGESLGTRLSLNMIITEVNDHLDSVSVH